MVQYRRDLVDTRTALTHRLAALLKLYFPQALQWAGDLDTFQGCDFLQRWPTLAKVQKMPATKLAAVLCPSQLSYRVGNRKTTTNTNSSAVNH
jgi:hypothetical protein